MGENSNHMLSNVSRGSDEPSTGTTPGRLSGSGPQCGFLTPVGCHTWRVTRVMAYLENGGRLEHAQQMVGHESPRSTKFYDSGDREKSGAENGADTSDLGQRGAWNQKQR